MSGTPAEESATAQQPSATASDGIPTSSNCESPQGGIPHRAPFMCESQPQYPLKNGNAPTLDIGSVGSGDHFPSSITPNIISTSADLIFQGGEQPMGNTNPERPIQHGAFTDKQSLCIWKQMEQIALRLQVIVTNPSFPIFLERLQTLDQTPPQTSASAAAPGTASVAEMVAQAKNTQVNILNVAHREIELIEQGLFADRKPISTTNVKIVSLTGESYTPLKVFESVSDMNKDIIKYLDQMIYVLRMFVKYGTIHVDPTGTVLPAFFAVINIRTDLFKDYSGFLDSLRCFLPTSSHESSEPSSSYDAPMKAHKRYGSHGFEKDLGQFGIVTSQMGNKRKMNASPEHEPTKNAKSPKKEVKQENEE